MQIQITSDITRNHDRVGTYRFLEIETEGFAMSISFVVGVRNYVSCVVRNASQRAWKKIASGKEFPNWDAAIDHYKSDKAKALLMTAQELCS